MEYIDGDNYFDYAEALHTWLSLNHEGQSSRKYELLSQSLFSPGAGYSEERVENENPYYNEITEENYEQIFNEIEEFLSNEVESDVSCDCDCEMCESGHCEMCSEDCGCHDLTNSETLNNQGKHYSDPMVWGSIEDEKIVELATKVYKVREDSYDAEVDDDQWVDLSKSIDKCIDEVLQEENVELDDESYSLLHETVEEYENYKRNYDDGYGKPTKDAKVKELVHKMKNGVAKSSQIKSYDGDLGVDYEDSGPWRSYNLAGQGETLKEFLEDATISEVNQNGGELACYGIEDAPRSVEREAIKVIMNLFGVSEEEVYDAFEDDAVAVTN